MRKKHALLEAHEIVPYLWQGSVPPKGDTLQDAEIKVLVLCAREWQIPADEFPGVRVIHAPNDDSAQWPLTREKLRSAVQAARQVTTAVHDGQTCLVTCAAGMNRSGLVSALALHMLYDWSGLKCIQHVRQKRGPHRDGYKPLSNPEFTDALRQLKPREALPQREAAALPEGYGWSNGGIVIPL